MQPGIGWMNVGELDAVNVCAIRSGVEVFETRSRVSRYFRQENAMIENIIWATFIGIPIILVIAAIVATVRTNRQVEFDDE